MEPGVFTDQDVIILTYEAVCHYCLSHYHQIIFLKIMTLQTIILSA